MANETYFCRRCQKPSAGPICPDCGLTAFKVAEGGVEIPPAPLASVAAVSWPGALPQPAPETLPPAPPVAAPSPEAAQIAEYLADGFQIFLVAGIGGAGKTHLMETFRGQDLIDRVPDVGGFLMPTRPTGFDVHPFPHGKKRAVFVDTSGEHYSRLHAVAEEAADKQEIQLLEVVAQGLGGLILLLKLSELWDPRSEGKQPRVLTNVLRLMRWLRGGGRLESEGTRSLPQRVDSEVERMPLLRVPVMLLFSFADQLHGHELPRAKGTRAENPGRKIFPSGEDPLLILHHYAPEVLAALEKHAHCFHVDFCHSVVKNPESGEIFPEQSCGVASVREWLLRASERQPLVPTRFWLKLDRRFYPERWAQLPPARPLGA